MAYEVVARRWRPLTFDSVVGQKHVTATLANALANDRVAHAFLFTGIRGVGKTTVARLLARALNCTERKGAEPCNECSSCTQILAGSSVDVLEIDGASNRGIDEVRTLIEAAAYRPAGGRYRVYIIDEVHQLTREAFNALLKILEEPPSHVKFVFATTEPHKLPQTVLSRCQRYDFRRLTSDEIVAQLEHITAKDELQVKKDALALLAREADGSMRDAQSLLEQVVAASGGTVGAAEVSEILGIAGTELLVGTVEAILGREPARIVEVMHEVRRSGFDPERFLNDVLELVRHVSIAQAAGAAALGPSAPEAFREAADRLKDKREALDLQRIFTSLLRTGEDLRRGSLPELVLEMGLLKAAMLESVVSASELLQKLESAGGPRGPQGRPAGPPPGGRGGTSRSGSSAAPASRPRPEYRSAGDDARASAAPRDAAGTVREAGGAPAQVRDAREGEGEAADAGAPHHDSAQWEGFLAFVRDEGGFDLYVTLSNCEVVRLELARIELRAMVDGFKRRLDSAETLGRITELARRHFDRDVAVAVAGQAGTTGGLSVHSIEADKRTRLEERALADPLVQTALDVLGGKVGRISRVDE
jgi:DNA polymerase-3 subunit gamma/tau